MFTKVGNQVFFATDGATGLELWRSDGTEAGTIFLKDLRTDTGSPPIANMTAVGNSLFFTTNDGIHGYEVWRSDGTPQGTSLLYDINVGKDGSSPVNLTAVGNTLYFAADDSYVGRELWKSDGTEAGTKLVKDASPGTTGTTNNSTSINSIAAINNTVYFLGSTPGEGSVSLLSPNYGNPMEPTPELSLSLVSRTVHQD